MKTLHPVHALRLRHAFARAHKDARHLGSALSLASANFRATEGVWSLGFSTMLDPAHMTQRAYTLNK